MKSAVGRAALPLHRCAGWKACATISKGFFVTETAASAPSGTGLAAVSVCLFRKKPIGSIAFLPRRRKPVVFCRFFGYHPLKMALCVGKSQSWPGHGLGGKPACTPGFPDQRAPVVGEGQGGLSPLGPAGALGTHPGARLHGRRSPLHGYGLQPRLDPRRPRGLCQPGSPRLAKPPWSIPGNWPAVFGKGWPIRRFDLPARLVGWGFFL